VARGTDAQARPGTNIEHVSEYPDTLASMPGGPVLVMLVPTAWTELCEPLPA
jgi:hypothetical protein